MNTILKNMPAILLLFAGLIASFATYVSGKDDQKQKDSIEELGKQNIKLSSEIFKLNNLNKNISTRVEEISKINNKLSTENLELNKLSHNLIFEVNLLTTTSKKLIDKIDERAAYQAAENLQTGEINMNFNSQINENDKVYIIIGGNKFSHTVKALKEKSAKLFSFAGRDPFSISLDKDNRMLFSIEVYDIEGNLIAEIENNNWRPNKNFTGKFNYDDRGFEVIDNKGNVAINFTVSESNKIIIQGIFQFKEIGKIFLCGNNGFNILDMTNIQNFNQEIDGINIAKIFRYTGKNWLHSRL